MNWTRGVRSPSAARLGQQRLGHARHAFEQHVAAPDQGDEQPLTVASCPTTALPTSARSATSAVRGGRLRGGGVVCWSQSASLLLESVEVPGQVDQVIIAAGCGLEEHPADLGRVAPGPVAPRAALRASGSSA